MDTVFGGGGGGGGGNFQNIFPPFWKEVYSERKNAPNGAVNAIKFYTQKFLTKWHI